MGAEFGRQAVIVFRFAWARFVLGGEADEAAALEHEAAVLEGGRGRDAQHSLAAQRVLAAGHIAYAVVERLGSPFSLRITLKTMRAACREVESLRLNNSRELVKKTLILALVYRYNTLELRQTRVWSLNQEAQPFRPPRR